MFDSIAHLFHKKSPEVLPHQENISQNATSSDSVVLPVISEIAQPIVTQESPQIITKNV
jgi:hypothetical protein